MSKRSCVAPRPYEDLARRLEKQAAAAALRVALLDAALSDPLGDLGFVRYVVFRLPPGADAFERVTGTRLLDLAVPSTYIRWVPYREGVETATVESHTYPFSILFRVPKGCRDAESTY